MMIDDKDKLTSGSQKKFAPKTLNLTDEEFHKMLVEDAVIQKYKDALSPATKTGQLDPDEWNSLEGPYNDYATREELIKRRDDDQSFGEAFGIGLLNLLPNTALSIIENVGALTDFDSHIKTVSGTGSEYSNILTDWARNAKNPFGEIYTAESNDPGEADWWLKNGFGVAESALAFAATGAGVGSLAGKATMGLAKILEAGRTGQTIARLGASTLTNASLAYAEGVISGATVYDSAFKEAVNQGKSDIEANEIAAAAAAKTVRINTVINSVLNIPQTKSLFRDINYFNSLDDALKRIEGETTEQYLKRLKDLPESKKALSSVFSKENLLNKGAEMGSESLEEVVNQISEDEGTYQYLRALGKVSDKDIFTRLGETLKKEETWSAAFWGAIGGLAQPALMNMVPKKVKEYDDEGNVIKEKWTTVGKYNIEQEDKIYRDQVDGLVTHLGAIQDAKKNLAAAAKAGDETAYKKAQDELFGLESYQSVVKGLSEQAKDSYREIQMLSEEEAANQGFNVDPNSDDYYKHLAARKMTDIDHLTRKYTELNKKYNYDKLDPELYGYHNELFSRYIDIYNNRQNVDKFDMELVKAEAEYKANRGRRGMDYTISAALDVQTANKAVKKEFDEVDRQEESLRKQQESGTPLTIAQKKLFGPTYDDVFRALRDRKVALKEKSKEVTAALDQAFELFKQANFEEGKTDAEYSKEFNKAINDNEAETEDLSVAKFMLDNSRNELNQREETYYRMLTDEGKDMFKKQKKKAQEELKAKMEAARKTEEDIKAKEEAKKKETKEKIKKSVAPTKTTTEPEGKTKDFEASPFADYTPEDEVESGDETPPVQGVAELFGKPGEEGKKEEPPVKDTGSNINTGLANNLDELEDGEFYGKGQGETLPARIESVQKFANNPEGESGGLVATDGNTVLFENNKLVMATTAIAYGTSKDFEEYNIDNTHRTRTTSNKLSEELTSNVVLSKTNTLPGDKVTVKVLSSLDFKPYTLSKDWTALDVDGNPIKTYPKGTLIDYNTLSSLGNNYVPIGIFNASNELIGYLHDMSYMRDERVVSPEADRKALNMFRDYIIKNGGEVISNIETTSLGTLSINIQYTENSPIERINGTTNRVSSEAIPTLELAVAKTQTTAFTQDNENSLVTGTKNNFTNSPLIPGAIYAIAEGKGGQKLLCPIDTMQLGDIKEVADTLYTVITAYYKANKTAEDIEVLTKLFGQSYRGKDIENFIRLFIKSKDLTKVVDPRTNMITTEFEEDRFYFDVRPEGNEIQFGKSGTKVFSLNTNQKTEATKSIKQLLYSALQNSYVSISLARKTEFANKPVSYNLLDAEGKVIRKSHSNYNDFIKSYTFTNLNEYQINYKKDGKQVTENVIFDNPVISINPIVANKPKEVTAAKTEPVSDKKDDIERRRQEDLAVISDKDYLTKTDKILEGLVDGEVVLFKSNFKYVLGGTLVLNGISNVKSSSNIISGKEIRDAVNAKYDAEYVDAVKKGEMTKEQAIQALKEVGRKDSKAYAELDALEGKATVSKTETKTEPKVQKTKRGVKGFDKIKKKDKPDTGVDKSIRPNKLMGISDTSDELTFHTNTLNVVSSFLEAIGIEQRLVPQFIQQNGTVVEGAIAAANFIDNTVDIIEDLEKRPEAWNKLPEEAAHWWYRLLNNNSELKKALWNSHKTALKRDELYKGQYGKLVNSAEDLTEESIGQLIAEAIKRIEEKNAAPADYSFLKKFLDWLNSTIKIFTDLYKKQDPFEVAAMKILSSDLTDLMTVEEYNELYNKVYFNNVLANQSVKPLDYTLLSDMVGINNEGEVAIYEPGTTNIGDIKKFNTDEERDLWVYQNYGELHDRRQKQSLQEIKDNQAFFDRLLNKTFRKRSRFLPKTLRKYFDLVDSGDLKELREWNIGTDSLKLTKKLTAAEKSILIATNGYENITPTLKILPTILAKYKKNPISLNQPLKVDGMKKEESTIINSIISLIKQENPTKKSISAEELVNEVHNFLEVNFLLGFANEQNYATYNVANTFEFYNNAPKGTEPAINVEGLTEEQLLALPLEQRNQIAQQLGLKDTNPNIYHNKVSIRFNDNYYHNLGGHFKFNPSAWGNLTYFYTGKSNTKDAVLLHEIQSDVIENLREYKAEAIDIESELGVYLDKLNDDLISSLQIIETGGFRVRKKQPIKDITDPNAYTEYNERTSNPLYKGFLGKFLIDAVNSGVANEIYWLDRLKERIAEIKDLYESYGLYDVEKVLKNLDQAYIRKRRFDEIKNRGGFKALLSKEDLDSLKEYLIELNSKSISTGLYLEDENIFEDDFERELTIGEKKEKFKNYTSVISKKLTDIIKEKYGIKEAFNIQLIAPAKPTSRGRGARTRGALPTYAKLNESVDFLLAYNERKIYESIGKTINTFKQDLNLAFAKTAEYNFVNSLSKITADQLSTLLENTKFNIELFNKALNLQSTKDIKKISSKKGIIDTEETIEKQKEETRLKYEELKEKAYKKKEELAADYSVLQDKVKQTLEMEMGYFTPLVHHLIQKHIKQSGKGVPMYFSGYNVTKLTQGSKRTALIYAGKEEIEFTKEQADDIKYQAAVTLGLVNESEGQVSKEEVIKRLTDYKRKSRINLDRVINTIMQLSDSKPIETGALFNAMTQVPGVRLVWEPEIKGIKGKTGGYLVDLSGYNFNTPVLYGLAKEKTTEETDLSLRPLTTDELTRVNQSKAGLFNPGKIDIYQQTEVLNYLVATVANDITANGSTFEESINNIKEFFEYNEEDNSDLTPILEVWDKFSESTKTKVEALSKVTDEDFFSESEEESRSSDDTNNTKVTENYSEDKWFTVDANKSISGRLRRLLISIQDGENYLGLPKYKPVSEVMSKLQSILVNAPSADYAYFISKLREHQATNTWISNVVDILEGTDIYNKEKFTNSDGLYDQKDHAAAIEKFEATKTQLQNEFAIWAYKHFVEKYTNVISRNKNNNQVTVKTISANQNDNVKMIISSWIENLKLTDLVTTNDKGNLVIDADKKKAILDKFKAITEDLKEKKYSPTSIKFQAELSDLLSLVGIDLDTDLLDKLAQALNSGTLNKKYTLANFTEAGGIFKTMFDKLASNKIATDAFEVIEDEETQMDETFNVSNPLTGNSGVNTLARWLTTQVDDIISNSFYDNGKTIWSYSVNKHISSQIYKLKNDKNFVEFLRSCDFQSGSYVLDMLSDATEGIAGKDLFKQWFKMAYVSSIKKSKSNAKELEYMEEPELEKTRLAFFMNQGDKDVKTGLRKVRHVSLTTSDKKNLAVFNMLAFTPNLTFDTTTGKFTGFNEETVQELINLIQGEYTRIYNYQNTIKADPSIKGNLADDFVKGAEIFYLFPVLNDKTNNIIWDANGNLNRFDSKVSEEVGKILSREAAKLVENKIATWRSLGIDNFLDSTYIKKVVNPSLPDTLKNNKEAMLAFAAADYELNQVRNNLNLYQLFSGDIAYYYKKESTTESSDTIGIVKDTLTNLGKRLAAQIAPGNSLGNTNSTDVAGVNGHEYIQVIAKDQEVVSNNLKYLKTILDKTGLKPYESVEPTDAQEYTTLKEHLYVMFHEGKIPDDVYKSIMKRLETQGDNIVLDSKELGFVLQPVKPVYFDTKQSTYSSSTTNNKTNTLRPIYVKTSSIPLIPQFTKGMELDKLRKSMEDLQKSENKLVRLVFKSGIKVGKPANIAAIFTGEDKRSIKDNIKFSPDNYLVLNRDGFRIQQEVPFDANKAKINRGSQEVKILFTDILDVRGFNYGELNNVDGRTLQKEYKAKMARLYKIGQEKLLDELDAKKDADGKVVSYNKEKLVELLKEEIKARGLSPDYYDALKLVDVGVDKVFTTPLMFLNRSNKFESLILSLVDNRVRKQKNPGWSSPLVSSAGIMTLAEAKEGDFNENSVVLLDGFDLSQGLKSMRVEDGKVMPAQILAPFKFRDNKGNLLRIKDFTKVVDGKVVLDTDKLPRELLQSYGFRIPTSLQMSLSHMEIVGFLPESMGDSLIAPEDFTKQMGSDFDIDKLYAYLYNTIYNKKTGKLAKYTPANVREAKYDSYLAKARKRGDSTIIPKDEFDTTFDEVKLLQNDLLDIRLAVLDNPSSEVQSKIHAAIGFDELKATANRIQKIKDSKRGAELITPLSSEYQNKKYLNGRGGKAGTGVFSSSNTFNSLLQTVSDKMTYNKSMVVKTATGFRKVWVPTNIIFTESKGTNLNNPLTSAGGSKGAIHSAFQNASVDNEKEAILEKINVNRHTFSAIVGLIQDGHDENTIAYLINQPIILDYVNELAKYQDATSDERVDNPEAAAFNFIKEKYFNNVDANIMEMYFNHETPISMIDMVKSLELEDGYDRFTITQINAFAKFSQANDMGRTLQSMASTLNTDSAGLGKDFFSLYTKKGKLEKLVDPEKIPQVSNKELLIDSINGYASEAVDLALDLFGSLFPVNNQAFNAIWSNFREDNQKVEDMDSDTQAAVVSNIFENFKSFIVATEFNKLLEENNSSLEAERQRLLVDTNTNKSFATITKIYQSRIKNPIVIRLSTKIVKDGKGISQVFFDASKGERLDESEMYQAYIDMLNSDNVITEINSQPYTEKDYARDLATYYFITGGVFNPKSFGKFIANNYMEAIGLSENLRTVNFENEVYFSDFYRQYMQNNPYRATKLTSDNDIIVKSSVLKSGNTIVGFKTTDFSGKYIMLDDNNLYEFNADLDYYNLIPQLGSQFASEYYPTRFVENTNKTIVHLSAYPENKLPIELTKPVQTTATEEIKTAGLLESPVLSLTEAMTMLEPIEGEIKEAKPTVAEVEKTITYTPIGKKEQTYTIKGNEIFNKKGEKVFTKDSKDRNRIFANLAVQEGRAVVVDWKNDKYVVNNKGQIISVATGDIMKWPANNGDRIGVLDEAQKKFEAKAKPVVGAKTVNTVVNPIEKPVTGQSGLDSRTEAEKAREVKSINNKIVASTTTLDSLGFEKSMDNIDLSVALLNLYKDTSLSESNRSVALLLNRALEGNNVKFKFESLGANAEVGKYDHTTNTVTINSDSNVSKGDMLENILHELTHSVTSRAIKSVLGKLKTPYEYTTAQKAAVLNLEKLYDYTRELILSGKLEQFGYSAEELKNFEAEVAKKIADKSYNPKYDIATFDKYYGISMFANREKKVEEFVAMAMSNKNFQVVLNSVQAPKSDMTLMDKFIEQIKKIVEGFLTSFKITLDTGEKVDLNKDNLLFESLKNIVVLSMDSKENYMETTDIGSLFGASASPFGEYEATDEDIDSISDEEANDYKLNC